MAQPPCSIYCSTLINPQAHSLVFFHASFIFPKIAPAFLRENAHALRKFFIHRGKIIHTLEHSLRLSEVSPTLGHTLSMVVSWEISTYGFSTLRFLIFSHFPSFCPAVAFRLVFPTMTHGCSTDVDHPASPRATRAPSLGFCCFCFHNSSPLMKVSLTTGTEEQVPPSSATESSSVPHYIAIISVVTSLHFDIVFLPSLSSLQSHFSQS